jgi:alpha-1,3-mannosyltransferase
MTCAMDYINPDESTALFYDVYVSRQINGDLFFDVTPQGGWENNQDLFWNDDETKRAYAAHRPFQVFACWNGVTAFTAQPFMNGKVKFRPPMDKECFAGEPTVMCKDFWYHGYGKIAVVPSVAVGYFNNETALIKKSQGTVTKWLQQAQKEDRIAWKGPPEKMKCVPDFERQSWVPWDNQMKEHGVVP